MDKKNLLKKAVDELNSGFFDSALSTIQYALSINPNHLDLLQLLGEAYFIRGSYDSARLTFEDILQKSPTSQYLQYCHALCLFKLLNYESAVEKLNDVLRLKTDFLPAIICKVQCYFELMKLSIDNRLYFKAQSYYRVVMEVLMSSLRSRSDLIITWVLMFNCLQLATRYKFTLHLTSNSPSQMMIWCCMHALSLKNLVEPNLWFAFGVATLTIDTAVSFACFKKALNFESQNAIYWSGMGICFRRMGNLHHASQCFNKAVSINPLMATAWSNLGYVYLESDYLELAHRAFQMAQSSEPTLQYAWIGQALIAERVEPTEALDLFRHSASLIGEHPEAIRGFAYFVCKCHHSSTNETALAALDSLARYTQMFPEEITGWWYLSLIALRLKRVAEEAFNRVLQLADPLNYDSALCNYATFHASCGKFSNATDELMKMKQSSNKIFMAYLFFKQKRFDEALQIYCSLEATEEIKIVTFISRCFSATEYESLSKFKPSPKAPFKVLTIYLAFLLQHEAVDQAKSLTVYLSQQSDHNLPLVILCAVPALIGINPTFMEKLKLVALETPQDLTLRKFAIEISLSNNQTSLADLVFAPKIDFEESSAYLKSVFEVVVLKEDSAKLCRDILKRIHMFPSSERLRSLLLPFLTNISQSVAETFSTSTNE